MSIALNLRLKQKYDTSTNWMTNNPILLAGEHGYESDTGFEKVGDGTTAWNSLTYINADKANTLTNSRTLWGQSFNGSSNVSGSLDNTGNITPSVTAASDIGSSTLAYKDIHYSNNLIHSNYSIEYDSTNECLNFKFD